MAGAFAPADSTASSAIRVFPLRVEEIIRMGVGIEKPVINKKADLLFCLPHHGQSEAGNCRAAEDRHGDRGRTALSPTQMPDLMRRAQTPGIVWGFQGLGLDEALKVWKVATPEERATLRPHLQKKMQTLGTMPQAERERLLPLARQVLGQ